MKILYIGHYRNGLSDGWARCSNDQIHALEAAGIDVVIRPVILGRNEIPEELKRFEKKSAFGYDLCIQHLLPHHMVKYGKCIGSFVYDSSSFKYSSWETRLQQMDDVWIPNHGLIKACNESNIKPRVIPHTIDISKYKYKDKLNLPDGFKFYAIIDFNKRKNLLALLKAFYLEFRNEPVHLVLKISKPETTKEQIQREYNEISTKVKQSLRIHSSLESFKQEIVIIDYLTNEQIYALHNACDAYVCTSYQEAWCYPAFDAMGFGNIVISNKIDGPSDYIKHEENGFLIDNQKTPCFGAEGFNDIYTGYETWKDINIPQLRFYMRKVYEENLNDIRENARQSVKEFSYEKIGKKMREACELFMD